MSVEFALEAQLPANSRHDKNRSARRCETVLMGETKLKLWDDVAISPLQKKQTKKNSWICRAFKSTSSEHSIQSESYTLLLLQLHYV